MMRRWPDSMTKLWIEPYRRPSACAKCGLSQAWRCTSSVVAAGNMNVDGNGVPPNSATRVILTSPTCQRRNCSSATFEFWLMPAAASR